MKRKYAGLMLVLSMLLVVCLMPQMVFAEGETGSASKAKRTILLYDCGSNLETYAGLATYNLLQVLRSSFSSDDDIRFVVMTGGSTRWQMDNDENYENDNEYLVFPEGVDVPKDAVVVDDPNDPYAEVVSDNEKGRISGVYNQLWEAKGADAAENAGKMILLDGDGITGEKGKAVKAENELMSDPEVLKAFINFGVENYPADKYDLILWDHGGGPLGGFGSDDHYNEEITDAPGMMLFPGIVDALAHNKVTENGGKFDFVDFDACLMGSVELALVLADYTDYYIASAELEPGYGQYYGPAGLNENDGQEYTGWLDELGNPAKDEMYNAPGGTFELGKVIVDDFYRFYEKERGDGASQEGTLAVFDTQKMISDRTGFIDTLRALAGVLIDQAIDPNGPVGISFYDELKSYGNAINYGDYQLFDLGQVASCLSVVNSEISEKDYDKEDDYYVNCNKYGGISRELIRLMENDSDKAFMYAKSTRGIKAKETYYMEKDGSLSFGSPNASCLSLYFPTVEDLFGVREYYSTIDLVTEGMPEGKRKNLMKDLEEVAAFYNLILYSGDAISGIINDPYDFFNNKGKDQVDCDMVLENMHDREGFYGQWDLVVKPALEKIPEFNEDQLNEWYRILISQQIEDAVDPTKITAAKIKQKNGEGYRIKLKDAKKHTVKSIERNVIAELPELEKYIKSLDSDDRMLIAPDLVFSLGSAEGELYNDLPDDASVADWIKWYNESGGMWDIGLPEMKWYALNGGSDLSVASIHHIDSDGTYVPVLNMSEEGPDENRYLLLEFSNESNNGRQELLSIYFMNTDAGAVQVMPKDLKSEIKVMPILYIRDFFDRSFYIPISKSTVTISPENAGSLSLEYTDVDKIKDIADTDGDGKKFHSVVTLTDIYDTQIDVMDAINSMADGEMTDIAMARIRPGVYGADSTGELVPEVVCLGETLVKDVDYTLNKVNPDDTFDKVGDYEVKVTGIGRYTGKADMTFHIVVPEEEAAQAVEDAKAAAAEAKAELDALPEDATAEQLKAAYGKLVKAQNALADAVETLNRTQQILSEEEKAKLEDEIANLEEEVQGLNQQLAEAQIVDISNYAVTLSGTSFGYTGKAITPKVKVAGLSAEDYIVAYSNNVKIGTATVKITPINKKYKGEIKKTFQITKGANKLAVKGKTATVKYKKLKKKNQTLKVSKVIKVTKKGQGKLSYQLVSAKKGSKNFKKKFSINKKTGKVTVKKGLKKGTYKLKVKVRAAGDKNYKASAWKTVKITIKVK